MDADGTLLGGRRTGRGGVARTLARRLAHAIPLLCLFAWFVPASAIEGFSVPVDVNVTAENGAVAKERGFAKGQADAFAQLWGQLAGSAPPPKLGEAELSRLVRDFEIVQENIGPTRYIARLVVHFVPENVQALIAERGIAGSPAGGQLTAVVPVGGLAQWVGVEQRLKSLPGVHRVQLQAVNRKRVQVTLYHLGSVDRLAEAMREQGLNLEKSGEAWTILAGLGPTPMPTNPEPEPPEDPNLSGVTIIPPEGFTGGPPR